MAQATSNPFSIQIRPLVALASTFEISSNTAGAGLPFTLGYAFRQGDVPAGSKLIGNIASLQVVPKNTWPDGSLKFAVISGHGTLAAGTPLTITLGLGAPAARPDLGIDRLLATGIRAAVTTDAFGQAAWSGADWNAPFMAWISGPEMSSWIYRKPVGSDAHLVAWLEVRLYAGGAVEVLPWIENGYLLVPGPTNKSATYKFTLGDTERFSAAIDLPNHCRTPLVSGSSLSHWLGAAPALAVNHNKAYLQATRLVPAYSAAVPPGATVWAKLAQTYTPLQQGNYAAAMGMAGYQAAIGLLPEWDVLYLASDDPRAWAGVICNAYSAGRFGIHYRDETTQRPVRLSSYPNLVVGSGGSGIDGVGASTKSQYTPVNAGTVPKTYDLPHHPSMGYTAYLLTGRFYFMEEVQFLATLNFLKQTDWVREFSSGILKSEAGANTTRGAGWALRTLAQACCVTPDSDTVLRGEFTASMAANAHYLHDMYVVKTNNPFGIVRPYSNYTAGSGKYSEASWMQDFHTASVGYAVDIVPLLPNSGNSKLAAFFQWKARSIVGRLGGTADNEFLFSDAAVYTLAVAPSDAADFAGGAGPFYASWGDMYAATLGTRNPGVAAPLRGGNYPEPESYWGNLQPAIAYAVQHQVPGAQAAFSRMTGASNWSSLRNGFNAVPVWSVIPHPQ